LHLAVSRPPALREHLVEASRDPHAARRPPRPFYRRIGATGREPAPSNPHREDSTAPRVAGRSIHVGRMRGIARVAAFCLIGSLPARADVADAGIAPSLSAGPHEGVLACEAATRPGRVRCEARVYVANGESITWGDVVLLETPPFLVPLRGRVGPHDATVRTPMTWRWEFALVARATGDGDVVGRARLVVCREKTCQPRELPLVGHVAIGPDASSSPPRSAPAPIDAGS
jgi:hypothetical protein